MLWFIFIIVHTISSEIVQSLFHNDSDTDVRHGSCTYRSIRQAEFHWDLPGPSMTESFVLDNVEYKLCRYHVTWDEARVFCSSYKSHLATLDSDEKTAFVVQAITSSSAATDDYWIGGRRLYDDNWSWNSNEMRIRSENNIIGSIPIWYPGFGSNDIHCLTIDRSGHDEPIFVSRACNQRRGFICQRDNDRIFDNKIRMVAASRIGEQEFRLYAGRATWAEAVVHCRQEGLQIGEVNTVKEARALAISMLRNRPEGIESAWIGGYTRNDDPGTWLWLASGEKISNNDMWRKNVSETVGGCLLLDRHVCESPVYVESNCDRKRDVLCQKPLKKRFSKIPKPVIIDGCEYWIGFHPSEWSDAQRSCESLNSSLVVLDSPATISHMMRLMLDNKSELRHIWIDGRRSKTNGHWQWAVNGDSIPDYGKSFIPWCPDDDYLTKDSSCLNLDRENFDSPLVYGLSCREKQTYVCQPHTGDCVHRSTSKMSVDPVNDSSEDIQKQTTLESSLIVYENMTNVPMSTITTAYKNDIHNRVIIQTTLRNDDKHFDDNFTREFDNRDSQKNNSFSHDNFGDYLKPFSRLTLPQLPQFGIRVVSATETITKNSGYEMKKNKNKGNTLLTNASRVSSSTVGTTLSSLPTIGKKYHSDVRKLSKLSNKIVEVSNASNTLDLVFSTVSSISSIGNTIEKSRKFVNSTIPISHGIAINGKSFLSRKKFWKHSTTISTIISNDFAWQPTIGKVDRGKKNSTKTTRDLNSSYVTKNVWTTTKNSMELPIATTPKNIKLETKENDENLTTKFFSTLVPRRRQNNFRISTEPTTPYDAIDEDYYNDDNNNNNNKDYSLKKIDDDNNYEQSDEYSDDYDDSPSSPTPRTKKKLKKTSMTSIRRNKTPRPNTYNKNEDDDDEKYEPTSTVKPILMAEQLSKNMKNVFIDMMQRGIERRKNFESSIDQNKMADERRSTKTKTTDWIRSSTTNYSNPKNLRSFKLEKFSLRPYYAFEGPIIMNLAKPGTLGGAVGRTGDNDREFKFIGKKFTDDSYHSDNEKKLTTNETRRYEKINGQSIDNRYNGGNNSMSMSKMAAVRTGDPDSLMQLGRYFKNTFGGLGRNFEVTNNDDRRPPIIDPNDQMIINDRGRYEKPYSHDHQRIHSTNGDVGSTVNERIWEKHETPRLRNYNEAPKRIYPRGNYDIHGSYIVNEDETNAKRLKTSWSEKTTSGYKFFDNKNQPVSPRSFSIPIRTTRSFHEEVANENNHSVKRTARPPDFRLSKLVKEVKIDMDEKMLRKYLEGFARKVSNKNSKINNDFKSTWRRLLRQIMTIIERMNVRVNGDPMKLKFGDDYVEDESDDSMGNSRQTRRNSISKKHRKYSMNVGSKMNINETKKQVNETPRKNNHLKNVDEEGSFDNLPTKNLTKVNNVIVDDDRIIYHTTNNRSKEEIIVSTNSSGNNVNREKPENKYYSNDEEILTNYSIVDSRGSDPNNPKQLEKKWKNFSGPKFSKSRPSIFPVARLSTVFGYRPLMPQLHHRIIFQPGWNQIRSSKSENKKSVVNGEYLAKGTLSRIVTNDRTNQHELFHENDSTNKHKKNVNKTIVDSRDEFYQTNNKTNEIEKNNLRYDDFHRYRNVSYANELDEENMKDDDDGKAGDETRREIFVEEKITDPTRDNNELKTISSSAHRLGKALELSVLRKFGSNLAHSLISKNLVTRNVENIVNVNGPRDPPGFDENVDHNNREETIDGTVEHVDVEPSVVSLRMTMQGDEKSPTISRPNSGTVEMSLEFSGQKETARTAGNYRKIDSTRKELTNRTKVEKNFMSREIGTKVNGVERPTRRIVDDERRRAMFKRLREKNDKSLKKNYVEAKAMDKSKSSHYMATSLRSFVGNNLKNGGQNEWGKNVKSYEKSTGIDWEDRASALFADLKESNDDITLYIDFTLGRVGSKPRNGARSKG